MTAMKSITVKSEELLKDATANTWPIWKMVDVKNLDNLLNQSDKW